MGPAMVWLQGVVGDAEARTAVTPSSGTVLAEPGSGEPAARVMNPCAVQPKAANPCAAVAPQPANPCAGVSTSADPTSPWLLRMMSLMAHLVYGGVVALVYRRKG